MSGADRLSDLPDDILRRVLHFSPAREGASTSALSKRWRGLWRSAGAVKLHARIPDGVDNGSLFSQRDAFVSAAMFSLRAAATDSPVTRLSFRLDPGRNGVVTRKFLSCDVRLNIRKPDVLTELLSLPAARRVEELLLSANHPMPLTDQEVMSTPIGLFNVLEFVSLPTETLLVLDISSCGYLDPSAGVAFLRLALLRLSLCGVSIKDLQDFIHSAPSLATIHLESVMLQCREHEDGSIVRLLCPAATKLVLDRCCWTKEPYERRGTTAVEIGAPKLRSFMYKGLLRQFSLSSQAPDLAWVKLHIFPDVHRRDNKDAHRDLVTFWRFARNFSNTRELKLRVGMLQDIAVVRSASQAKPVCSFCNLERLELEGMHMPEGNIAAVAVANLLRCSPMLRDLRINLTVAQPVSNRGAQQGRCLLEKKYRHDLERSIHSLKNRRFEPMVSRDGDYDDGEARYDELPGLSGLSGQVFGCLQSTLSCVSLQFRPETNIFEPKLRSNFATKLIKFFAENAEVLKEMHIDGGNEKMCEHMNCSLERWVANSSEKRKTNFVVLPLER